MNRRQFMGTSGLLLAGCATGGKIVIPPGGVAASSQKPASAAGAAILRRGGTAADAAVAMAAVLNVTEPTSTGLGGDMYALYYEAAARKVFGINGSGRAPRKLTLDLLNGKKPPPDHGHNVTVPGACAGWCDLQQRWGELSMKEVLAPAIRIAEEGFVVQPVTGWAWGRQEKQLAAKHGGMQLLVGGKAPKAGETFRNPNLAKTLRAIASDGKDAYYRGEIAKAVVAAVEAGGGVMSRRDLEEHASTWDEPISTDYRGVRVWECRPNGQGIIALIALNILEGFDLKGQDPLGPDRWHLLIEAMRLAFADGLKYVADRSPTDGLLSKEYAAKRREMIDPQKAGSPAAGNPPKVGHDTVYFCVVDGAGNACSFINSNYMGFGTCLAPEGWGFTLQNRGYGFEMDPAHANSLAPGKRPYHTNIPGMMTNADGSLVGPFGVMGGFMQPQGHVQVVTGLIDDRLGAQAVLDRPRFCVNVDQAGSPVSLEEGLPEATVTELVRRGHTVKPGVTGFMRSFFGRGQIIRPNVDAGSDTRADGCVVKA